MKRRPFFLRLFIVVLSGLAFGLFENASFAQENAESNDQTLRILCYNIRTARGLDDLQDYDRIAAIILKADPDVVALQELDRNNARSANQDIVAELAKRTGYYSSFSGAIEFRGGEYGVGILSKEKPIQTRNVSLPGKEEKRTLLIAEFENFIFGCTHLSLTANDRRASVDIIEKEFKNGRKPSFLAGDMNAEPNSETLAAFSQTWATLSPDSPTFPANDPNIRIDYIFGFDPTGKVEPTSDSWQKGVLSSDVLNEPLASDHRPVFVEFDLSVLQ